MGDDSSWGEAQDEDSSEAELTIEKKNM